MSVVQPEEQREKEEAIRQKLIAENIQEQGMMVAEILNKNPNAANQSADIVVNDAASKGIIDPSQDRYGNVDDRVGRNEEGYENNEQRDAEKTPQQLALEAQKEQEEKDKKDKQTEELRESLAKLGNVMVAFGVGSDMVEHRGEVLNGITANITPGMDQDRGAGMGLFS